MRSPCDPPCDPPCDYGAVPRDDPSVDVDPQQPTRSAGATAPSDPTRTARDVVRPRPHEPPATDLDPWPAQLGHYEIERRLGAGGMDEVFVARRGEQRVALKTLQRASSTNLLRFKTEFRALADGATPVIHRSSCTYAGLTGPSEQTTALYERALEAAAQSGMVWLAGLAAERLAHQAERHAQTLLRQAALERARSYYQAWGATALVRRIHARLTAVSAAPGELPHPA